MTIGSGWSKRAWVWWGAEILAAAILLLALAAMHQAILRNALALAGLHLHSPAIVVVNDACGNEHIVPPALGDGDGRDGAGSISACDGRASILVTARRDREVLLLVNGRVVDARQSAGLLRFNGVRLRPGSNLVTVRYGDGEVARWAFPFFSNSMPVDFEVHRRFLDWLAAVKVPMPPDAATVAIEVASDAPVAPRLLRVGTLADGSRWGVLQGEPNAFVSPGALPELTFGSHLSADGLGLVRWDSATPADDPGARFSREVVLERAADGGVEVSARACLPEGHRLLGWARDGAIDAPELLARLFGLQVGGWIPASSPSWRERRPVRVGGSDGGCVDLELGYRVPEGHVWLSPWDTSFLALPGDELTLQGFAGEIEVEGRPADETGPEVLIWRGQVPTAADLESGGHTALRIQPIFSPGQEDDEDEAASDRPKLRVLAAWRDLADLVPGLLRASLWGLAAAMPVALMLWAFGRYARLSFPNPQLYRGRAGLVALLVLLLTLAAQPVLIDLTRSLVNLVGVAGFVTDRLSGGWIGRDLYTPIAILAVTFALALLRGSDPRAPQAPRPLARALAALASVAIALVALLVLLAEQWIVTPEMARLLVGLDPIGLWQDLDLWGTALDLPRSSRPLATLVMGWILFGLGTFWIPVYWLVRTLARDGSVARDAFGASLLIVLIPAAGAAEVLSLVSAHSRRSMVLEWLAILGQLAAVGVLIVVVALFLRGFARIAGVLLGPGSEDGVSHWGRTRNLLILSLLIVSPLMTGLAGTGFGVGDAVLRLMTVFQAYGAALALLAPLGLMLFLSRDTDPRRNPFVLPDGMPPLLAAAFAGYLTLWLREPMSMLVLMAAGWYVFLYGILGSPPTPMARVVSDLGRRLLDYRSEHHLLDGRARALEKRFSAAELAPVDFAKARSVLAHQRHRARTALGLPPGEAKRQLLEWGPGRTPLQNAWLGAKVGLVAAGALQLLLPLDLSAVGDGATAGWSAWLRAVAVDPSYQLVVPGASDSQLLVFLSALLNAVALWVIAGFLFGYSFHRIRGDDGFVKAVVFGVGVSVPYLLSRSLLADAAGALPAGLERLVPLLFFLLVLGALVFDGMSLHRERIPLTRLPEVYGLRTSLGYASFAGLLASLQPLLQLLDWVIGSGG